VAALGADLVWYVLGKYHGRSVLRVLCRISLEPDYCVRRTEDTFERLGLWALLPAKFIPGFNAATVPMAGMVQTPLLRFLSFDIPGVLLWATVRAVRDRLLRPLVVCAWCYLVWAFGSWLTVGGVSTGLILPANFFGFVPVLSNARIPGRALVVVFLAVGLLTARLIASLPRERQGRLAAMLALVLVIDFCPAPVATVALDRPAIYAAIPPENGVVLELPMGLRDGFGEIGAFDERTLLHQMTHGHPLVGGFLARLPQSIKRRYADLPVIRSLLAMSDGQSGPTPEDMALSSADATQALKNVGVRYVVLDHGAASPQLSAFVASLHLSTLQRDGSRELLLLDEQ